jgi:hypothetical protein
MLSRAFDGNRRPPETAVRVPTGQSSSPRRGLSDNVIWLQRAVGNRAVGALLRSPTDERSSTASRDAPAADLWAGMVDDARAKRWAKVVDQLMSLPIESLLDALERLRDSGLLSALRIELPLMPIERTARFDAAMLAISNLSTDERLEWRRTQQLISDDELKALQARKRKWLESGTAAGASPVRRWDYQTYSPYKGGKDLFTDSFLGGGDISLITPSGQRGSIRSQDSQAWVLSSSGGAPTSFPINLIVDLSTGDGSGSWTLRDGTALSPTFALQWVKSVNRPEGRMLLFAGETYSDDAAYSLTLLLI